MTDKKIQVALFGATGLIGNHLTQLFIADDTISSVKVLSRKSLELKHPKIKNTIAENFTLEAIEEIVNDCDVVFCAIGTTRKKVNGDKKRYESIDYQIPLDIAKASEAQNIAQLHIVSAIGADAKNRSFYLSLKGRMERDVSQFQIPSIYFYRPSLLLGDRKEKRFAENLAQRIMPLFNWATPNKYKAISGKVVAKAMLQCARNPIIGRHVMHYLDMKQLCD